jgi:hypothetical protein
MRKDVTQRALTKTISHFQLWMKIRNVRFGSLVPRSDPPVLPSGPWCLLDSPCVLRSLLAPGVSSDPPVWPSARFRSPWSLLGPYSSIIACIIARCPVAVALPPPPLSPSCCGCGLRCPLAASCCIKAIASAALGRCASPFIALWYPPVVAAVPYRCSLILACACTVCNYSSTIART